MSTSGKFATKNNVAKMLMKIFREEKCYVTARGASEDSKYVDFLVYKCPSRENVSHPLNLRLY